MEQSKVLNAKTITKRFEIALKEVEVEIDKLTEEDRKLISQVQLIQRMTQKLEENKSCQLAAVMLQKRNKI